VGRAVAFTQHSDGHPTTWLRGCLAIWPSALRPHERQVEARVYCSLCTEACASRSLPCTLSSALRTLHSVLRSDGDLLLLALLHLSGLWLDLMRYITNSPIRWNICYSVRLPFPRAPWYTFLHLRAPSRTLRPYNRWASWTTGGRSFRLPLQERRL
jgi:hypothetical protein